MIGGMAWRAAVSGVLLLAATIPATTDLAAQEARDDDVATLDGILAAYYEVVSGPARSAPDRERDRSLHHPDALVAIAGRDATGRPTLSRMTLDEYHDRFGGPRATPFYEWETGREVRTHGTITHVWSAYASSDRPDGPPTGRGVNSIQLHHDGDRWWILSWMFDGAGGDPGPVGAGPGGASAGAAASSNAGGARGGTSSEARAVVAAVQEFFDAMAAADVARSRAIMAEGARFYSVRETDGRRTTSSFTAEEHLARLPTAGRLLERMWDAEVRVEGAVASVVAPYDFYRDGAFSHCGTDAFTLLRGADGRWVLTGATYTVVTDGCPPSPLGPPGG